MTLFFSLFTKGASDGLRFMFQCTMQDLSNLTVWRSSVEQAIVSLGLGMGPVITLGSMLKFHTPCDRDSFFIVILVGIVTILSGTIVFCTAGILAAERNQDIRTVLYLNETYTKDIHVHVVFSQLFTRISPPWSSIISFLFFFTLFIAGWYPLITYLQSAILICYSYIPCLAEYKYFTELGFCLLCFISGLVLVTPGGYYSIIFFDELLVTTTIILVVICELCAMIYVNGLYDFSDDIAFMIGFEPNFYIKLVWIFSPWALLGLFFMFINETNLKDMVLYEKIAGLAGLFIVFTPVALVAFYNIYICYKEGDISKVFTRKEVTFESDNVNPTGKSVPWFRKMENVAGPSHVS
ncbi:hypothetical protein RI129_004418 [Pyrocoelia pectoralis]|uniref:Uncharacterized protein n=1 Tax=Pyrocoelia pectoralis TaxID=417401 RepID=A0AAN7VGN9_9COLE